MLALAKLVKLFLPIALNVLIQLLVFLVYQALISIQQIINANFVHWVTV